ncbi:hypothetical protein sscle_13g094900 [Sclerotinia sclerotiorum 1980 UF-70]|uniref:Major facilitator superfamily (MFS) profile domain-containing protein n=1 Tax=Sclerotinia sclerotiorum (strain ATCC 18683 / 1980 / Ss-1) TaxID=665079 RepID=A0A1D9QIF8_SCLS1|nr:hypothetical protein sscle_13g094900 [Sclerotinia sclerotiorum 1980 UF-70]
MYLSTTYRTSGLLHGNSEKILTIYVIATAIPKITSVFNSRRCRMAYLSALVLFEIGSIICAAARNSVTLIVRRAVAGAGASALFSGGMTIGS